MRLANAVVCRGEGSSTISSETGTPYGETLVMFLPKLPRRCRSQSHRLSRLVPLFRYKWPLSVRLHAATFEWMNNRNTF